MVLKPREKFSSCQILKREESRGSNLNGDNFCFEYLYVQFSLIRRLKFGREGGEKNREIRDSKWLTMPDT